MKTLICFFSLKKSVSEKIKNNEKNVLFKFHFSYHTFKWTRFQKHTKTSISMQYNPEQLNETKNIAVYNWKAHNCKIQKIYKYPYLNLIILEVWKKKRTV